MCVASLAAKGTVLEKNTVCINGTFVALQPLPPACLLNWNSCTDTSLDYIYYGPPCTYIHFSYTRVKIFLVIYFIYRLIFFYLRTKRVTMHYIIVDRSEIISLPRHLLHRAISFGNHFLVPFGNHPKTIISQNHLSKHLLLVTTAGSVLIRIAATVYSRAVTLRTTWCCYMYYSVYVI